MPLHALKALEHPGLLKPSLSSGHALEIAGVPCELFSSR